MRIPNGQQFIQKGDSDVFPYTDIVAAHGIVPEKGKLTFSPRMLLNYSSDSDSDLGLPVAFEYVPEVGWYALCGNKIFQNGDTVSPGGGDANSTRSPFTTFYEAVDIGLPISEGFDANSDLEYFPPNGDLYVTAKGTGTYKTDGSGWTEVGTNISTGGFLKKLCYHRPTNFMYQSYNVGKIISWDSSDSIHTLGNQYTLDIGSAEYITSLISSPDWIWILNLNITSGGESRQYYWDGSQSSGPNGQATLDDDGALAGWVQFNTLFVVTTSGRIMQNNGKTFIEVAKFPFGGKTPKNSLLTTMSASARWIMPNGVTIIDGKPNFLINPEFQDGSDPSYRLMAGIWELDPANGYNLYLKHPLSYHAKTSGSVTDYAQLRLSAVGALASARHSSTDNGSLLAGASYFKDATTVASGIFIDDTADTIEKYSSVTTAWLPSQNIKDIFQEINARMQELLNSTDKLVAKYRTKKATPVIVTGTWVSTSTFNTTTDLRNYVGWEVEVLNGTGGGKTAHISSCALNGANWLITLDDTFTGVTTGTFKARVDNWTKCQAEFSSQTEDVPNFSMLSAKNSTKAQLKLCFQGKNKNEIFDLILTNVKAQ